MAFYIATLQVYLLLIVILRSSLVFRVLVWLRLRPAQLLCVSFLVLIAVGTLLLMLPGASRAGARLPLVDALFTSTSAVCVTGLVVRDTGAQFTPLGLTVVLGLIQVGGLGILTITASFALFSGRRLSRTEEEALARTFEVESAAKMRRAIGRVVLTTLALETVGATLLYRLWTQAIDDAAQRWAWAVFHSISAFCNAGFALFPDNASLTAFGEDCGIVLVVGGLIVAGGLGYGVVAEMGGRAAALSRRPPHCGAVTAHGARRGFSRHARWVLWSSSALIVAGALALWLLEAQRGLVGLSPRGRWLAALFQSITLRTAGFNTVDLAAFGLPAVVVCIVWMLVGGSPGGTAGGVKTTTAAVGLAAVAGRLPRRAQAPPPRRPTHPALRGHLRGVVPARGRGAGRVEQSTGVRGRLGARDRRPVARLHRRAVHVGQAGDRARDVRGARRALRPGRPRCCAGRTRTRGETRRRRSIASWWVVDRAGKRLDPSPGGRSISSPDRAAACERGAGAGRGETP